MNKEKTGNSFFSVQGVQEFLVAHYPGCWIL